MLKKIFVVLLTVLIAWMAGSSDVIATGKMTEVVQFAGGPILLL